jgi:hypothetical protein
MQRSAVFMSTRTAQHQDAHYAVGHDDAHDLVGSQYH